MGDTLVTATAVPNKLFYMRIVQKSETGSITKLLFSGDVIATNPESARATAIGQVNKDHPDADLTRIGVAVSELQI